MEQLPQTPSPNPCKFFCRGAPMCAPWAWADTQVRPYGGIKGGLDGRAGDFLFSFPSCTWERIIDPNLVWVTLGGEDSCADFYQSQALRPLRFPSPAWEPVKKGGMRFAFPPYGPMKPQVPQASQRASVGSAGAGGVSGAGGRRGFLGPGGPDLLPDGGHGLIILVLDLF